MKQNSTIQKKIQHAVVTHLHEIFSYFVVGVIYFTFILLLFLTVCQWINKYKLSVEKKWTDEIGIKMRTNDDDDDCNGKDNWNSWQSCVCTVYACRFSMQHENVLEFIILEWFSNELKGERENEVITCQLLWKMSENF